MPTMQWYLEALTDKVFKILPMMESRVNGRENHLEEYLDSLCMEMAGACDTFPQLSGNPCYLTVLNIANYLARNRVSLRQCKREVFKCISLIARAGEQLKDSEKAVENHG